MSAEQSLVETLREYVDIAVHEYSDVLRAVVRGEQVDEGVDFRAHSVAVIACSVLASVSHEQRGRDYYTQGLLQNGLRVDTAGMTNADWNSKGVKAFASLRPSRSFKPDEQELLAALLTNDPRIEVVSPKRPRL